MAGVAFQALQIVDDDLSTILFDLDDSTGTTNPGGVQTMAREFKLRAPELQATRFAPSTAPGAFTAYRRAGLVATAWLQRVTYDTYDNGRKGVGALSKLLEMGGAIKIQELGASDVRYVQYEPSNPVALLGEDDADLWRALTSRDFPRGIPIGIARQPFLFGPLLDPAVNVLVNPELLWDNGSGRPVSFAWDTAANISAESIDGPSESYTFTIATAANRNLQQSTGAASAAPGDIWSFSFYARVAAGSGARAQAVIEYQDAGAVTLRTDTGTLTTLSPVWQRITLTTTAAPASTDRIRVSLRMSDADGSAYTVSFRLAQLEKAGAVSLFRSPARAMSQDPTVTNGLVTYAYNPGDAPARAIAKMTGDSGSAINQVLYVTRGDRGVIGRRRVVDYANGGFFTQLEDGTLGTDTSAVADGGASGSGNNAAECTFASNPTVYDKRISKAPTTKLAGRRGRHDIYLRMRATGTGVFYSKLRVAANNSAVSLELPEDVFDTSAATAFGWNHRYMGQLVVPDLDTDLTGLLFEVHSRRDSGSGSLRYDYLTLASADEAERRALLYLPDDPSSSWLGSQLVLPTKPAGLTLGDVTSRPGEIVLSAQNKCGGSTPAGGTAWGAVRITQVFDISLQQNDKSGTKIGVVRVWNETDDVLVVSADLIPTKGSQWTRRTYSLAFDAVGGKSYSAQIVYTAATTAGWKIFGFSIDTTLTPSVANGEFIRSDPRIPLGVRERGRAEHLDTNSKLLRKVKVKQGGVPLVLDPGLTALYAAAFDTAQVGYDLPQSTLTRAPIHSFTIQPAWYG